MARSLERHLTRMLAVAILLAGVIAGALSFLFAYWEAEEFQDDTLRQIAALAAGHRLRDDAAAGDAVRHPESGFPNPESRVLVLRADREQRPSWLPAHPPAGFHTFAADEQRFRAFVRHDREGRPVVAAQPTGVRNEIAVDSALRTLVPLVALLPVLLVLTVRLVRREMEPVRRLARTVDEQSAERPAPLPVDDVPEETAPFVRAINRLLERVRRLLGEQRRFIADAAHELRTPLTALSLQAQNLEQADTLEAVRDRVAALRAGIERARRLTEQLLSLARTQAIAASAIPVEISKMARDLIADYMPLAETRGIDLGLDEPAGHLLVTAEPETLRLILKNGLDNAVRYTPPAGEVTVRIYAQGDHAVIDVIDNGPGIPAAERDRVFDPFHRMEGSGGEGSGLGLAIARDAAERLGGTVSLHDRTEEPGLVFRYRQPRVP